MKSDTEFTFPSNFRNNYINFGRECQLLREGGVIRTKKCIKEVFSSFGEFGLDILTKTRML